MRKTVYIAIILICFIFAFSDAFAQATCSEHLFYVAKSDNSNVLYYDAAMKNGLLNPTKPVNIYWIMYNERNQTEDLTFLERPHFGINVEQIVPGKSYVINVKNKQLEDRDITVAVEDDGCVRARAVINGKECYLENIFIQIKPNSGLIPNVLHIDLEGREIFTGNKVTTRILNQ